jgi:hypothetical protein
MLEVALNSVWSFLGTICIILSIGFSLSLPISIYYRNKQLEASKVLSSIRSKILE